MKIIEYIPSNEKHEGITIRGFSYEAFVNRLMKSIPVTTCNENQVIRYDEDKEVIIVWDHLYINDIKYLFNKLEDMTIEEIIKQAFFSLDHHMRFNYDNNKYEDYYNKIKDKIFLKMNELDLYKVMVIDFMCNEDEIVMITKYSSYRIYVRELYNNNIPLDSEYIMLSIINIFDIISRSKSMLI